MLTVREIRTIKRMAQDVIEACDQAIPESSDLTDDAVCQTVEDLYNVATGYFEP